MGTVVSRTLPSLPGGWLEITITVPVSIVCTVTTDTGKFVFEPDRPLVPVLVMRDPSVSDPVSTLMARPDFLQFLFQPVSPSPLA